METHCIRDRTQYSASGVGEMRRQTTPCDVYVRIEQYTLHSPRQNVSPPRHHETVGAHELAVLDDFGSRHSVPLSRRSFLTPWTHPGHGGPTMDAFPSRRRISVTCALASVSLSGWKPPTRQVPSRGSRVRRCSICFASRDPHARHGDDHRAKPRLGGTVFETTAGVWTRRGCLGHDESGACPNPRVDGPLDGPLCWLRSIPPRECVSTPRTAFASSRGSSLDSSIMTSVRPACLRRLSVLTCLTFEIAEEFTML
ncbi:hypothetical protein BV20DRAFT_808793 [Pilatotrama ljubarskyi]|nr:hypothetical protein BV20DRAFT_808793 [Pilatotrama ljubarskyi]